MNSARSSAPSPSSQLLMSSLSSAASTVRWTLSGAGTHPSSSLSSTSIPPDRFWAWALR